jgi:hypothetical protein
LLVDLQSRENLKNTLSNIIERKKDEWYRSNRSGI